MSFFRANAEITGGRITNVAFVAPNLVDMANTPINNTGDPVLDADAVNKRTLVNYVSQRVTCIDTNLQGDGVYVAVDERLYGAFNVKIMGHTEGKPIGVFIVAKSSRTTPAVVQIVTSGPGVEGSRLNVTWPAEAGIHVGKLGVGDNGIYEVKIF